jgi:hypothetical protein
VIKKSNSVSVPEKRDMVKELAWEVARNVIDHHKWVYSKLFENAPSTFSISLRNGIYNEIQSAIKCHSDLEIHEWIAKSQKHRAEMRRLNRLSKKAKNANGSQKIINEIIEELKK